MDHLTGRTVQCPLCASDAAFWGALPETLFDCAVCGRFKMNFDLTHDRDMQGEPHPYLSAATRKASAEGIPLMLTMDNWRQLEDQQRSMRISQKLTDLLRLIAARSETLGQRWSINLDKDYPLIAAANSGELSHLLAHLHTRGWLEDGTTNCQLTVPGWEALEPLPRSGGIPGRCFVAMSFSTETREAYESGIEPAVRDAGFTPVRIDKKEHNNEIPDEIIAEIRNCQFMVADFTGQRAGVYYEAGFAMGLGRSVIWCCRKDEIGKLHFDTNHRNHIDWENPEELRERLYRRIRATILERG
jgi:nucleoside 2-deoxyribosyltransferase